MEKYIPYILDEPLCQMCEAWTEALWYYFKVPAVSNGIRFMATFMVGYRNTPFSVWLLRLLPPWTLTCIEWSAVFDNSIMDGMISMTDGKSYTVMLCTPLLVIRHTNTAYGVPATFVCYDQIPWRSSHSDDFAWQIDFTVCPAHAHLR